MEQTPGAFEDGFTDLPKPQQKCKIMAGTKTGVTALQKAQGVDTVGVSRESLPSHSPFFIIHPGCPERSLMTGDASGMLIYKHNQEEDPGNSSWCLGKPWNIILSVITLQNNQAIRPSQFRAVTGPA